MAAIQKVHTDVYFIQSKIDNPILSFLIWNTAIGFSKEIEKNSIPGLMTKIAMFDCFFFILFAREKSHRKKQRQAKTWYYGKAICYKTGALF